MKLTKLRIGILPKLDDNYFVTGRKIERFLANLNINCETYELDDAIEDEIQIFTLQDTITKVVPKLRLLEKELEDFIEFSFFELLEDKNIVEFVQTFSIKNIFNYVDDTYIAGIDGDILLHNIQDHELRNEFAVYYNNTLDDLGNCIDFYIDLEKCDYLFRLLLDHGPNTPKDFSQKPIADEFLEDIKEFQGDEGCPHLLPYRLILHYVELSYRLDLISEKQYLDLKNILNYA